MTQTIDIATPLETPDQLRAALAEVAEWEKSQNRLMIWDKHNPSSIQDSGQAYTKND